MLENCFLISEANPNVVRNSSRHIIWYGVRVQFLNDHVRIIFEFIMIFTCSSVNTGYLCPSQIDD